MKIKVTDLSYREVMNLPEPKQKKPKKQSPFFRKLMKILSQKEMKEISFSCTQEGMERIGKGEPCLFLMNHSSFTDLQIAATLLSDRQYHIICTRDGFVGREGLRRSLGCVPTEKFVTDIRLVRDMKYCFEKLHSSILLFPEASYSFDGSTTPLPDSLGKFVKMMKVPVVMIRTHGAFLRDPLYNNLKKRNVRVSCEMKLLYTADEIASADPEAVRETLRAAFAYDHFREQDENGIVVSEPFRAEGLERVLYRCPSCLTEGSMHGEGTTITCSHCGKTYELGETGRLRALEGDTEFAYVTDWYAWERGCVRRQIEAGLYRMQEEVDILILKDMKSMYRVGSGTLTHTAEGFRLTGCGGELDYFQDAALSYSLYADYYWYEIGDMISIGDHTCQYYCFPKNQQKANVAKARLAAEELYRQAAGKR